MYNSKYYTCEQIDQRLLQGYYDDAVAAGYTGSKAQYLAGLLKAINHSANPTITADKIVYNSAISGLTSKNVQGAIDELANKKFDKASIVQESGDAEDKVMSQKATTTAISDETTRAKAAEQAITYDVSAHNSGVVFESLSALLSSSNLSTLIPTSVRHGGMIIRFIQGSVSSSDNKYVQYRYMLSNVSTTATFTNVANWQGVDDEPTAGSNNLVTSGSVYDELIKKPNIESVDEYDFAVADEQGHTVFALKDGYPLSKNFDGKEVIPAVISSNNYYDLDLADEKGHVIVRFNSGHIKTKYFDSQNVKQDALAGLKMVGIGDSIMHGQSMGTQPTKPYLQVIAEYFSMTYKNYGIGGSTIAQSPLILGGTSRDCGGVVTSTSQMSDTSKYYIILTGSPSMSGVGNYGGTAYYHNGNSWVTTNIAPRTPLTTRYQLMDDDADLVLVAAGTNDFQYNWTAVGTIDDAKVASPSANTFYGAVAQICQGLITKYPKKTIIFLTPIKRGQTQKASSDTAAHNGGSYGTQDSENTFGKTLKQYGEIIKEVCGRFSIPVIDMYADCNLTPFVSAQATYFDSYKTHPDQNGHDIMARYLIGQLQSIFGKNINI